MYLLTSGDHGIHFEGKSIHPWRIGTCPMSSESLADTGSSVLAAWETNGQVAFSRIDPATKAISPPMPPPGRPGARKHPAVAGNASGEAILVWTVGTGWQKGGALAWQIFDPSGRPTGEKGYLEAAVPVWSLATVVARPDGGFLILH
jgi:hypothetical protein